jgi:hypothetical protein
LDIENPPSSPNRKKEYHAKSWVPRGSGQSAATATKKATANRHRNERKKGNPTGKKKAAQSFVTDDDDDSNYGKCDRFVRPWETKKV